MRGVVSEDNVVESFEENGKRIVIHANRFGKHRYWATVDGLALFQRGRMRIRAFTTIEAAVKAARQEAKHVARAPKARGVPGYPNFGGAGPFAPIGSPAPAKNKP